MTKEEIKLQFDELAEYSLKHFTSEIRGCLYHIKSIWNWSNEDIAYFLNTNVNTIEDMLSEDWNGKISAIRLAKIQLLSLGQFGLPGCSIDNTISDKMHDIIDSYKVLNTPMKTYDEKVQDILDLFGVTDENSLDKLLNAIIDVRKAIDQTDKDIKEQGTDINKNHNKCTISGSYYDSEKMDKPNTFKHTYINDGVLNTEELKKLAKNLGSLANIFFHNNTEK